jgi:glycosyltransferase involved in cell wall biosynthesis
VIVPVYNPGTDIDDCIRSLLDQSLPPSEYEVIFVDDGSTDDTPARLDDLEQDAPNVRVEHISNSGWPGRPRNVGLDLARGRYVYFVDNDDWLGREALERLHATAERNGADIVIGKVVGHGKPVPRTLFRRSQEEVALDWPPLLRMLTPHKLFRKELLDEHGIRFPEGRRRLEDHVFVVHAYFHARRISVLADYPCYHWMLRGKDTNASFRPFDPVGYFQNVREVLDVVDEHTDPGPLRDQLYSHWYRSKMLARVGGGPFVRREPRYNHKLYDEIRRLALERYDAGVEHFLPFNLQVRSALLRTGSYESLRALADFESELYADASVRLQTWEPGKLTLELQAAVLGKRDPLTFVRRGTRIHWLPPPALADELSAQDLDVTDLLKKARVEVVVRSRADRSEYVLPSRSELVLVRAGDGEAQRPVLVTATELDAEVAAAGSPLRAGRWELYVLIHVIGFAPEGAVMTEGSKWRRGGLPQWGRERLPLVVAVAKDRTLREWRAPRPPLLARSRRRLARRVRRVRARAGRAAR